VAGLQGRDRILPGCAAFNPRPKWADLQPTAGGPIAHPNAIDDAIASGNPFRVRLHLGRYSPDWLKAEVGTLTMIDSANPTGPVTADIPRWWSPAFVDRYVALLGLLDAEYGRQIVAMFVGGPCTFYPEPCLRQLSEPANRVALLAVGYTTETDITAQEQMIRAHHVLPGRVAYSFNPYQRLDPDGTWASDLDLTAHLMDVVRERGDSVIANNSLRSPLQGGAYPGLYDEVVAHGKPFGFQTAVASRVGDLRGTIQQAVAWGAHFVELPWPNDLSATEMTTYDRALRGNV
jgi:hypothetical protein